MLEGHSPSVYDLLGSKVSFSDGVARWDESVMLPFAPLSSPPGASSGLCQLLPGFFLRPSVAFGFLSSPLSSSMAPCSSRLGSVIRCVLSVFSSHSAVLVSFVFIWPVLAVLPVASM